MTAERWALITEVFRAALEKPAGERAAFLENACGSDEALRRDVERLLAGEAEPSLPSPLPEVLKGGAMELASGDMLAQYRVEAKLGEGGMGVVYRAYDTRLRRQVALKVLLPAHFTDPEGKQRLMREARAASALNHPHIVTVHEIGSDAGVDFIAMEYVEGRSLAQEIPAQGLPMKRALEYGVEIADALDHAHAAGVIHRDLKPGNVMVTGENRVKLLDFGLARRVRLREGESTTLTVEGGIAGTPAYMSPEQATGKPVDRRTDIWAFGCVMFEALSGKRVFRGETTTEVLVAILDREPDWAALPANTPENVKSLLRRCMAKDPRSRLHDIADARLELEDTIAGRVTGAMPAIERRGAGRRVLAGAAAGLLIGAAGMWALRSPAPAVPARVARLSFDVPHGSRIVPAWGAPALSFSRDSKTLVYPANFPPPNVVHVRRIDELDGKPLANAKGLGHPIFSPDDRWLVMPDYSRRLLVKVPRSGGAPVPLVSFDMPFRGDWGTDGYIYWTNSLISAIVRTPENGGKSEPVTELDLEKQERTHRFASLLPGGNALIFTVASGGIDSYDDARIDVFDLATKKRKTVVQGGTCPHYSPSGHLVYARGGSLYAVPFDPRALAVTGTPVKVVDGVLMSTNIGTAYYDISSAGDLAYANGPVENGERTLHWVDRQGKSKPLPLPPRSYLNPRISPDGNLLAVEVEGPNHDFYCYDFARGVMSRITNDGTSHAPIWSPDGKRIAFRTWKGGKMTLAWMPADRSGPQEMMVNAPAWQSAVSFSPDGKYLSFDQVSHNPEVEYGVWIMPLTGDRQPRPFVTSKVPEGAGKFSPDGKWLVYCSLESGKGEIYVQPWPGPGPKIQISSEGGMDPMWRRDGKEIFYRNASKMMAVTVSTGASFQAGRPRLLWEGEYTFGLSSSCGLRGATYTSYDVSPDGQRFLMIKDSDQNLYATRIVVVLNWAEELSRIMAEASGKKT